MIYEMARDLGERLAARKFPQRVIYGERTQREGYDPVIIVERDRRGGDTIGAPHGTKRNPRKHASRVLGVEIRIYAASPLAGAHVGDHERECEQIVDAVIVELSKWEAEMRANGQALSRLDYTESRYMTAAERADVETWPGVAYILRFRIGRGVFERDYENAAEPTAVLGGNSNTTHLRYVGQDTEPEIGCGADE